MRPARNTRITARSGLVGLAVAGGLLGGCLSPGAGVPAATAGASTSGESGESTLGVSSTSAAGTTGEATSSTSAGATSEVSTSVGDTTGGCTFLCDPDAPSDSYNPDDCDPFVQDCPEGEKCSPTAEESAGWYYDTVCNPIPRDPKKVGEPCSVEESKYSGIDDCEEGAMCWRVDAETLTGTCIALCPGDAESCSIDPIACCPEGQVCYFNRTFGVCDTLCHPITTPCPRDEGCYPADNSFKCVADFSGDMGAVGDPCEYINTCDPGTFCGSSAIFPGCVPQASGCCIPFCDLNAPACPDKTVCTPWYGPGEGLPLYADLGACVIPE